MKAEWPDGTGGISSALAPPAPGVGLTSRGSQIQLREPRRAQQCRLRFGLMIGIPAAGEIYPCLEGAKLIRVPAKILVAVFSLLGA
jgi:hypothetical protein